MGTTEDAAPRWQTLLLNWGPSVLFNIVLPWLTYAMLTGNGVGEVPALLASGAWPIVELAIFFALHRRIDEFGVFVLIFLAVGVVAAAGFNSPRLLLVKESAITGLFGLVVLISLALPRPLMFYFGRKFATSGTAESIAWWNGLWRYPSFRRVQRVISVVWGIAFLAEALLRIWLSYLLSTGTMVLVSSVLPIAVTGALVFWTIGYGRRARPAAATP
jgi:hypothetical protein